MKANDKFTYCTGTDHYYKHMFGFVCTDGVMLMAQEFGCFWLLDIIVSYQHKPKFKNESFQVWKLTVDRENETGVVVADDGNGNKLVTQKIGYTDFKADEAEIWLEGNVMLLPSEH